MGWGIVGRCGFWVNCRVWARGVHAGDKVVPWGGRGSFRSVGVGWGAGLGRCEMVDVGARGPLPLEVSKIDLST